MLDPAYVPARFGLASLLAASGARAGCRRDAHRLRRLCAACRRRSGGTQGDGSGRGAGHGPSVAAVAGEPDAARRPRGRSAARAGDQAARGAERPRRAADACGFPSDPRACGRGGDRPAPRRYAPRTRRTRRAGRACDAGGAGGRCRRDRPGAAIPACYHSRNDATLQRRYGETVARLAAARFPPPALPEPPREGERIRVGFASAFLHMHSVSKTHGGWIEHLDRTRFAVFGYQLSNAHDTTSARLEASCDRFARGIADAATWRARILADAPHVLIYLDIGMEQTAVRLAAQRLAPVQCTTWGHPVTSGLPTVDHYLSADAMEPPDGDTHYTERLVRLPNLGICYAAPPVGSARGGSCRAWPARRCGRLSLLPIACTNTCRVSTASGRASPRACPHRNSCSCLEPRLRRCDVPGTTGPSVCRVQDWTGAGTAYCAHACRTMHSHRCSAPATCSWTASAGRAATRRWRRWPAACRSSPRRPD